jgi:hypothetical protein
MIRPPFARRDRVYREIKSAIISSEYRMAEKLEATRLAHLHNASVTPVREALFRLMGEGLVQGAAVGGFQVQTLTQNGLKDMYIFNRDMLLMSLSQRSRETHTIVSKSGLLGDIYIAAMHDRTRRLFSAIFAFSASMKAQAVGEHLNDCLAGVRAIEPMILNRVEEELLEMVGHIQTENFTALRNAVRAYHQRRLAKTAQIFAELAVRSFSEGLTPDQSSS